MSHYSCPECSSSTHVIETRLSKTRIRRRRQCVTGHRFTTLEVPHDTSKKLKELVKWLASQGLAPDIADYARSEIDSIITGSPSEADESFQPEENNNEHSFAGATGG
jgi:hypothetical protein